jgi:hypothetical protein
MSKSNPETRTVTIGPDDLIAMVERTIAQAPAVPTGPTHAALFAAMRAARDEREWEIAGALMLLNAARVLSRADAHQALELLFERHVAGMDRH